MTDVYEQSLTLQFDPLTIEHLGYKMYSHLPNALAELIANAYDADATLVRIILAESPDSRSVTVEDDGHGMSVRGLNEKYLRIGRNRRVLGEQLSESGRRRVAGKKGLGKLALFGIGETIELRTRREGSPQESLVRLDWSEIKNSTGNVYHPQLSRVEASRATSGTVVTLSNLRRRTSVVAQDLAVSLGRLFIYRDNDFRIEVVDAGGRTHHVDRRSRMDNLERDAEWRVPDDLPAELKARLPDASVTGRIVATAKPVPVEQRGLALYAHGRLANEPEFFGVSESSYAFSYLTGYLEVDYIDEQEADVISTDRRAMSWDSGSSAGLRAFLQDLLRWIAHERRTARRTANRKRLVQEHGVDIDAWTGTIKGPEKEAVQDAAEILTSADSVIGDKDRSSLIESLRKIAPEYADLHWRHLHPKIQQAAENFYRIEYYHSALTEAAKRYVNDLRERTGLSGLTATQIVNQSLSEGNLKLDVSAPFLAEGFDKNTLDSMREGQFQLSKGAVSAFRNPLAHEEEQRLQAAGALTAQDCLDGLSIISHLYRRMEAGSPSASET
ncbi:TIGR02391 family protein [Kineosporia sp. NBRC 101731]|uniref:TIGR02391 family protein n=1 Tax=Kineosporia sp. NBRC 101731 TaxID=3032199 RepID=UPI0024A1694B|nr:TIGR02391 family protein [Kineosporia sp. NBRC 101731]GLY31593.1 hypothetical protein Kisp02_49580 [Kineosporia sp. NBRC 101731]